MVGKASCTRRMEAGARSARHEVRSAEDGPGDVINLNTTSQTVQASSLSLFLPPVRGASWIST